MTEIRNQSCIVLDKVEGPSRLIILKNYIETPRGTKQVWLSDAFNCLPAGIVCKDETGMGATTLELRSPRHSIVVEPLRVTAALKASQEGVIYVGSDIDTKRKIKDADILAQLKDREYKKIIVVADSLPRLWALLGESFGEYFLTLDEADSFQLDSNFRDSMGKCLDIYMTHPASMRALVTATPLEFSDPDLKDEQITTIKYEIPKRRPIDLVHCYNVVGAAMDLIENILLRYSGEKIMVAYNSVAGCVDMANSLVLKGLLPEDEIKVLCSSNSEASAGNFFKVLKETRLPGKVNFVTSAYFTGLDLVESIHLISISNSKSAIYSLSDNRLKQIAGRCRKELLSETIVFNTSIKGDDESTSADELIQAATIEVEALRCIKNNYIRNKHLQNNLLTIREMIVKTTSHKDATFVRTNIHDMDVVNYLSIDAFIENNRTLNTLYRYNDQLQLTLSRKGHDIVYRHVTSDTVVETKDKAPIDKDENIDDLIDEALKKRQDQLYNLITVSTLSKKQRQVYETCFSYNLDLTKDSIRRILVALKKRSDREFNNMIKAAEFFTARSNTGYKHHVLRYLPFNTSYTPKELYATWALIFAEAGIGSDIKIYTETTIVHYTNLHFKTTPLRSPTRVKILGLNPKEFVSAPDYIIRL